MGQAEERNRMDKSGFCEESLRIMVSENGFFECKSSENPLFCCREYGNVAEKRGKETAVAKQ